MRRGIVRLIVPGEPQGKQRAKAARIGKGPMAYVKTYTPEKTVNYETYIKELFAITYPDFIPGESVLEMELLIYLTIPASASKKKKLLMECGDLRPGKIPDVDNVLKVVMDALEGLAYKNDAKIVTAHQHKFYSVKPRLNIYIYELE